MTIVGIFFEGGQYYIAAVTGTQKLAFLEIKKNLDVSYQWAVSLLGEVSLKSFESPVLSKRAILAAVPFQAERLLPFSYEEAIVFPVIQGKKVWLFGTKKESLRKHLERWDTPFVVSYQMALYRYARWAHPQKDTAIIYFQGAERSFLISIEEGKLAKSGVLFAPYEEGAYQRLVKHLGEYEVIQIGAHAVATGLALSKNQFREGVWAHPLVQKESLKKRKHLIITYVAALLSFTFGVWQMGYREDLQLTKSKKAFSQQYGGVPPLKASKGQLYAEAPKVSYILAYLEEFHHLVEIDSIKVELLNYPSLKDPHGRYKTQVKLHFQPLSPQGAKLFQDQLIQKNRWIDAKEEIEFKRSHDGYQATFVLLP